MLLWAKWSRRHTGDFRISILPATLITQQPSSCDVTQLQLKRLACPLGRHSVQGFAYAALAPQHRPEATLAPLFLLEAGPLTACIPGGVHACLDGNAAQVSVEQAGSACQC